MRESSIRSKVHFLFAAWLALCAHFGVISALTVTTLIRGKDMAEILMQAVELLEKMKQ